MPADFTEGYASATAWVRGKFPGYEIVDASRAKRLKVSVRDIEEGDPRDPHNCAVVCAARRDGADEAWILRTMAILIYHRDKRAVRYSLNHYDRKLIREYDQTGRFEPQSFRLAAPCPDARIGSEARRQAREARRDRTVASVGPMRLVDGVRNWRRPS